MTIDGQPRVVTVARHHDDVWVSLDGRTLHLQAVAADAPRRSRSADGDLSAPMPAQVVSVDVAVGQAVVAGQVLAVLEAMKMQMRIVAPRDGVIAQVSISQNAMVGQGQVLFAYEPT